MNHTEISIAPAGEIRARHDQYLTYNYGRYPVVMDRGEGSVLWDVEGRRYVDLFAGFGAPILGHAHADLVAALTEQAHRLWHVGNLLHTEPQTRAAAAISEACGWKSPAKCFFSHAGADANEAAIKLARLYGRAHPGSAGPRFGVISATRSFHGRSFATMRATGSPAVSEGFEPFLPGFVNVAFNDLDAVRERIDAQTVAVLVEPIQGEGGIHVPDAGYLSRLRALCDERDLLLICDEVWTGCGRTGSWFAHQPMLPDAQPDVMTLGKGVGGGLAVGVMVASERVADLFDYRKMGAVKHATTLGGNCLSMAVTAKIFEVIRRDGLLAHAARMGEHAMARLREWGQSLPVIQSVRGRGLLIGVALAETVDGGKLTTRCMDEGVLVNVTAGKVLRLAPALTIDRETLDEGLDKLALALRSL